jgi:iron complex outermembrane receptor protein
MQKKTTLLLIALQPGLALLAENSIEATKFRTDSIQRLQEVVVTGSNLATARGELPFSISVVAGNVIRESGEDKVLTILSSRVPSLFVTERGLGGFGVSTGGSGAIKIRGVGGSPTSQVLMMVDGQPQFAGIYSHHVADAYTAEYVDRVEVVRGPASVLYGSNAMGGAINVITRNARKEGVDNTLSAQYGSYNTSNFAYTNTVKYGRFASIVSLSYDHTDGLSKGFNFGEGSGYAKVGYDWSKHWTTTVDYNLSRFSGSDPSYVSETQPDPYIQHVVRGAVSANAVNNYANTSGAVKVFYSYGNHYIYDPKAFHSLDDHFGVIAYQNFHPWQDNNITAGLDFTRYSGEIKRSGGVDYTPGNISMINRKIINEGAPYIVVAQGLWSNAITLNAGLRYVINDRFDNTLVPQGGFVILPQYTTSLKASIAKGYRNPSFKELYLYKPANPDLQPESMLNYEVSLTQYLFDRDLRLELTGYLAKGKDLIQTVAHPELGHALNENTGKFTNKGIELTADWHILKNLSANASYSYLHTSLDKLTGAPKNQVFLGLNWLAIKQLRFDAQLRHIGGLYVAESIAHEKYTLLDLKTTFYANRYVELSLRLDNLLNQSYTINYGYKLAGLTAFGGVKVKF